jgi:hypothetical protein
MQRELAYAQARLQARYGQRAAEPEWQRLLAVSDYRSFLEQARTTRLRPWVVNLSAASSSHEVERLLRAQLRARIAEVARWAPARWRAAVTSSASIIDLPALGFLERGETAYPWMLEETSLKTIIAAAFSADTKDRLENVGVRPSSLSVRAESFDSGRCVHPERWLAEWRERLPALAARERRQLDALVATVRVHLAHFGARVDALPTARQSWALRRSFEAAIVLHFRRGILAPAALFAYLLLVALEAERLRAELVTRLVFESTPLLRRDFVAAPPGATARLNALRRNE